MYQPGMIGRSGGSKPAPRPRPAPKPRYSFRPAPEPQPYIRRPKPVARTVRRVQRAAPKPHHISHRLNRSIQRTRIRQAAQRRVNRARNSPTGRMIRGKAGVGPKHHSMGNPEAYTLLWDRSEHADREWHRRWIARNKAAVKRMDRKDDRQVRRNYGVNLRNIGKSHMKFNPQVKLDPSQVEVRGRNWQPSFGQRLGWRLHDMGENWNYNAGNVDNWARQHFGNPFVNAGNAFNSPTPDHLSALLASIKRLNNPFS
jgi:hypothetical protein